MFLDYCTSLLYSTFKCILCLSLIFSICQYFGWIHRALHAWCEFVLSDIANQTKITVGSLDYDFWQGRVYATNVIVHTPLRKEWKWSSPIIARVGKVYVEFSLVSWILNVVTLWSMERAPIDIYTAEVVDVQGFIERQEQVFNFYLLDSGIILPDYKTIVPQDDDGEEDDNESLNGDEGDNTEQRRRQYDDQHQQQQQQHDHDEADEEAQQLVEQMLQTVQQVMSRKGTWKHALEEQRQTLTSKLRELQSTPNKVSAVQQHVRVMRQVGEAVAKKTQDIPAAPLRKEEEVPPPMVRVGRVIVKDLRIFTRDVMDTNDEDVLLETWNKPIRIDEVTVRASELTPPMSLLEEETNLPAIYQPIDKVWEVVWKRLLAESAKSQGGKLLNAAVGQVLGFMKVSSSK